MSIMFEGQQRMYCHLNAMPWKYDDATMRALRQTFVLTTEMVPVDQSVKQATTNFTYVIKSTNTHVQNMIHRTLLITNVSIGL
jgi:hypothetical protein